MSLEVYKNNANSEASLQKRPCCGTYTSRNLPSRKSDVHRSTLNGLLGEGLAQLLLLLLCEVGRDDLEVVLLELVDTLSGAVAPLVKANRAEVHGVTFSRTCFMKSSSIPTSVIEPMSAPMPGSLNFSTDSVAIRVSPFRSPARMRGVLKAHLRRRALPRMLALEIPRLTFTRRSYAASNRRRRLASLDPALLDLDVLGHVGERPQALPQSDRPAGE